VIGEQALPTLPQPEVVLRELRASGMRRSLF